MTNNVLNVIALAMQVGIGIFVGWMIARLSNIRISRCMATQNENLELVFDLFKIQQAQLTEKNMQIMTLKLELFELKEGLKSQFTSKQKGEY